MEINDSGGHLKIKFSNNDPDCGCLIGVKVRVNDNKDTNLSIHSSFFRHGVCLCGNSKTERALTWTRQNIIKTHIGPVGNRCVGESYYMGFDGKGWIGCTWEQNKNKRQWKKEKENQKIPQTATFAWKDADDWLSLIDESNLLLCKPVWKRIHPVRRVSWCLRVQGRGTVCCLLCIAGLCTSHTEHLERDKRKSIRSWLQPFIFKQYFVCSGAAIQYVNPKSTPSSSLWNNFQLV